MRKTLPIICLVLVIFTGCSVDKHEKYVPRSKRNREKYATPEPGTYIKPVAWSLLKMIDKAVEEPESFNQPSEWMVRMLTTHQKKVVDTLIVLGQREVLVRIYYPSKKSLRGNQPVTLFFHGGGFIFGSIEQYDLMVSRLARTTGHIFVSVEYELAPEHPFPAGIMDCYSVLQWVQAYGARIGADPGRISVMGDSAGGNIATVLTLLCRDNSRPQPECQVLLYPGLTFSDTLFPSRSYFGTSSEIPYVLSEKFLRTVRAQYMGEETDFRNPYLSPLEADLTPDLAPTLLITAECDPLRDEGRLYVQRLREAGVEVVHLEYSGMIHGFISFHIILSDALDAMKEIRDYLETI